MKKIFLFGFLAVTISINAQTFHSWNRKQAIIINNSLVEGTSPLINFPFLVTLDHLDDEIIDGGANSALNGGGDIRFSSDATGNNQLAIEVVEFVTNTSAANRKCQIWVKIPSLSATSDTTIYIWYNKAGEIQPLDTDTYGSQAVWSNYEAVWHMENDPSTAAPQIIDVTGNGYNLSSSGSMSAAAVTSGAIGNAISFDGIDDFFTLTTELAFSDSFTFSAWYYWVSPEAHDFAVILADGLPLDYGFYLNDGLYFEFYGGTGYASDIYTSDGSISQDSMQRWDFVATNGGAQHYLNSNSLTANKTTGVPSTGIVKYIGGDLVDYTNGWVDEIRVTSISRSSDWVKTEYANQTNAINFASAGIPEAVTSSDTQVPTAPTLSSTSQTDTTVDLSWTGATDNVGVTGYNVYKDNVLEATLGNVLTYQVSGLAAATSYNFTVTALDADSNESIASNMVGITTGSASSGGGTGYWNMNNQDVYYNTGNVGIGTNIPDEKLTVKGSIHSEEVKVDLSVPAPDYVFKADYNLISLEELQDYINLHGHLPNIPSAKEMEANGVELGIMNMKLLEKIEELTLYILKHDELIKRLKIQFNNKRE